MRYTKYDILVSVITLWLSTWLYWDMVSSIHLSSPKVSLSKSCCVIDYFHCWTIFTNTDLKSWKRLSKKLRITTNEMIDASDGQTHPIPQKFFVYLLLMECKMITYTKSPMHSLAKWWLWSSPEQSFQVELKDITEGDATRIMQSKYWLKPKLGGNVRTLFKYSDTHCQILPEILTLS